LKLAFTISSYRLCDFVHLGLKQLRKLSPESPILVSDDVSPESRGIASHASQHSAQYTCSAKRRGHFANDFQSLVHSLVFAKSQDCDVAVKVSQRFIFRKPESIDVLRKAFENPEILMVTPGQPKQVNGHNRAAKGFAQFTTLSDVVALRVNAISPEELLAIYRQRLMTDKAPWGSFMEVLCNDLHGSRFAGKTLRMDELTNPQAEPIYLRRYQHKPEDYRNLAGEHGFGGAFRCEEWSVLDGRNYLCKPKVV
jgi:hypothetical protein